MARRSQPISFESFADMAAHLDRWAASSLTSPAAWEDSLIGAQSWLDYSARNQLLLASYGIDGPVAGAETWRLVPSTHDNRGCAVRAGEHGHPVRVPVTTGGTEPDPYLGGTRPTQAAVQRWEWRPVFAVDQLARHPAPHALTPAELPPELTGPQADAEFLAAARKVAATTVRGRLPKSDDPHRVLADAAGRMRRSAKRPDLDPALRRQVAWLVADRVYLAPTHRAAEFDPSPLKPRERWERWERLQDVLEPARKLTAALGVVVGVDLVASPLPRMEVVDDRVVPAGRRHRLPSASLEQLPIGRWVTVGPYTPDEWAARGEHAAGQGAYLRLNKTAYVAAVETGDTAGWRLEDVATRTGNGLLATGTAPTLDQAQADAVDAIRSRYPALTDPVDVISPSPDGTAEAWEQIPGQRPSPERRTLPDQVTVHAVPELSGQWMPAVRQRATGVMERLPHIRTPDEARHGAELAGQQPIRTLAATDPARLDRTIAALTASGAYNRHELTGLIGSRLDESDRRRFFSAPPAGAVLGEGAAAIMLEELEFALGRGARILGEIIGYAASAASDKQGIGQYRTAFKNVLTQAMKSAKIMPDDVGHINAHGLSTRRCDAEEAEAIAEVFSSRRSPVPVVAAKSYFGNLGAASGAVELVCSLLALEHDHLFKTLNYETPDAQCPVNVASNGELTPGDIFINTNISPQGQASAVVVKRFK